MDGYQYEHHCAKLLKQRGFRDVTVTKSSGDQGIDVIAYNENVKYGIQCKYYSYPVGNQAVQQAYAGAKFYDCNIAVVMTNSTFTEPAKELAKKLGVQLWEKSYIPNGNGSLYKIIRAINVIWLLVSIFCDRFAILSQFSCQHVRQSFIFDFCHIAGHLLCGS